MAATYTIPDFGPADLLSREVEGFRRVKVQTIDISQDYILNGIGFDWWWRIRELTNGTAGNANRAFARFAVPAGFYMAIDNRIFQANAGAAFYRVYRPSDVDAAGLTVGDDIPIKSNLRTDAGIPFTGICSAITLPTPPSADLAFIEVPLFSIQGQSNSNLGEFNSENAFRLIAPGSVFYLELANESPGGTSTGYLKVRFIMAFIPESAVPSLPT